MPNETALRRQPVNGSGADRPALLPTDGELLMRFAKHGDRDAFALVVDRHSELVWAVCMRVLPTLHEAEDAYQATFLILAKKAPSIRATDSAAGWLFRVAERTALAMRRRRKHRREEPLIAEPPAPERAFPAIHQRQVVMTLMEELRGLPERYQTPLVLRYLEGRSRRQIADATDATVAAVAGRLVRGKRMLRMRLARRGVSLSAAVVAFGLASDASASDSIGASSFVSPPPVDPTAAASTVVSQLVQEGIRSMMLASLAKPAAIGAGCVVAVALMLTDAAPGAGDAVKPAIALQADAVEPPSDIRPAGDAVAIEPVAPNIRRIAAPRIRARHGQTAEMSIDSGKGTLHVAVDSEDQGDTFEVQLDITEQQRIAETIDAVRTLFAKKAAAVARDQLETPGFEELFYQRLHWSAQLQAVKAEKRRVQMLANQSAIPAGELAAKMSQAAAQQAMAKAKMLEIERHMMLVLGPKQPAPAPARTFSFTAPTPPAAVQGQINSAEPKPLPAEIDALEELVTACRDVWRQIKALHETGARGGSADAEAQARQAYHAARAQLAAARGVLDKSIQDDLLNTLKDRAKAAEEEVKALQAAYDSGRATLDLMIDSLRRRAEAKIALVKAEAERAAGAAKSEAAGRFPSLAETIAKSGKPVQVEVVDERSDDPTLVFRGARGRVEVVARAIEAAAEEKLKQQKDKLIAAQREIEAKALELQQAERRILQESEQKQESVKVEQKLLKAQQEFEEQRLELNQARQQIEKELKEADEEAEARKSKSGQTHSGTAIDPVSIIGAVTTGGAPEPLHPPTTHDLQTALRKHLTAKNGRPLDNPESARFSLGRIAAFADPSRIYPLIGPAQQHHTHYRCTVESDEFDKPVVFFVDHQHLHVSGESDSQGNQDGSAAVSPLAIGDVLRVRLGNYKQGGGTEWVADLVCQVDESGVLANGPAKYKTKIAGLTLPEAATALAKELKTKLAWQEPRVIIERISQTADAVGTGDALDVSAEEVAQHADKPPQPSLPTPSGAYTKPTEPVAPRIRSRPSRPETSGQVAAATRRLEVQQREMDRLQKQLAEAQQRLEKQARVQRSIVSRYSSAPVAYAKIKPGDLLEVEVVDRLDGNTFVVETVRVDSSGDVALGARWGRANVKDKSLRDAESVIEDLISQVLDRARALRKELGRGDTGDTPADLGVQVTRKASSFPQPALPQIVPTYAPARPDPPGAPAKPVLPPTPPATPTPTPQPILPPSR